RAASSSHMYTKAFGMFAASIISTTRRDFDKSRERARIAREISEEHGFTEALNCALWIEGYARFRHGEKQVGIDQQKLAIEMLESAAGSRIMSSWRMAYLAEAQLQFGEHGAAEPTLERAFETVKETGEGWAESELHRIAGEAILRK